ncbi:MAG: hypothetical protein JEZ11_11705 [Desulfobacterales bacterium]|nr:hypothetical protein [Desulfobacterales bacterium]
MTKSPHHLWIAAQKKRKREKEAFRLTVLRELDDALKSLETEYAWTDLYLFGSVTKDGRFGESSDVDIAIKGLGKNHFYAFVGELSSILNRSVDVVNLEECGFSEKIIAGGLKWNPKKKYGFS